MKKTVLLGILILMAAASASMAQDTIDTNYYRYDNHFFMAQRLDFFNEETGEFMEICPNGVGFANFYSSSGIPCDTIDGQISFGLNISNWMPYMYYKLSKEQDIHGIAIALDSIDNFTNGDSLTVILCDMADDHSSFIHLDSIVIKGGERGKRRWIEIPIMREIPDFTPETFVQYDDCIDTVLYRQVLEFYFDEPKHVENPRLWWMARMSVSNGSSFVFSNCQGHNMCFIGWYASDCTPGVATNSWDYFFPLITPLPEWEIPSVTQVIPYPAGAVIPDPDPDPDPDPEAIDGVYGNPPISIYPNPTNGVTTISSPEAIKELTVTDLAGRVLLHHSSMGTTTTLDTAPLEPGLYLLKVTTASGTATTKLAVR
ncbi:MAG: T9SS type A sorting domain-containing protein [Bacteroidales bacterium]|nr:T9SS type A sorting domain-containing protein [Bacteroidales bacterium]